MTALIVLIAIVAFALYQYLKGSFAKAIVMIFMLIFAVIVAFGFFEQIASLFISRTSDYSRKPVANYAQPLSFLLLFVLSFSFFQTAATFLLKKEVEFDPLIEKIGRVLFGAVSGLIFAGALVTVVDLSSISKSYLYERFNPANPDIEYPGKAFMNIDGFVTGLFTNFSNGSLSSKNSFGMVHSRFIDEVYLNFITDDKDVDILTSKPAIEVPKKAAAWIAGPLVDSKGKIISAETGHTLVIVRAGIKKNGTPFTISQLRIACNKKDADNPMSGKGVSSYPLGYIKSANRLDVKRLADIIKIEPSAFTDGVSWMDFVFNVPNDYAPVLLAFKQNNAVKISKLLDSEKAAKAEMNTANNTQ